jgi:enamine deaminase RidA (YjgF/YER057c/UK114 family)
MQKWEYATVPLLVHATKQILDTWGEDGWELVQVVPGPGGGDQLVAYLKRAALSGVHDRLPSSVSSCRPVVPPVAAYVPAVRTGDLVFTSGQLPMVDGQLPAIGKVGAW